MSILPTIFSYKSFHQISESSNIFAEEIMYKNYNISRQCALDGSLSRGTSNSSGYVNISASKFRVFINAQKSIMKPISTLEFPGVLIDSQNMTLNLQKEKVEKTKHQFKEIL